MTTAKKGEKITTHVFRRRICFFISKGFLAISPRSRSAPGVAIPQPRIDPEGGRSPLCCDRLRGRCNVASTSGGALRDHRLMADIPSGMGLPGKVLESTHIETGINQFSV